MVSRMILLEFLPFAIGLFFLAVIYTPPDKIAAVLDHIIRLKLSIAGWLGRLRKTETDWVKALRAQWNEVARLPEVDKTESMRSQLAHWAHQLAAAGAPVPSPIRPLLGVPLALPGLGALPYIGGAFAAVAFAAWYGWVPHTAILREKINVLCSDHDVRPVCRELAQERVDNAELHKQVVAYQLAVKQAAQNLADYGERQAAREKTNVEAKRRAAARVHVGGDYFAVWMRAREDIGAVAPPLPAVAAQPDSTGGMSYTSPPAAAAGVAIPAAEDAYGSAGVQ